MQTSAIKVKFEKFLQALPQAENRFSDAFRPSTEMVHLAPVGGHRASPYNVGFGQSMWPERALMRQPLP